MREKNLKSPQIKTQLQGTCEEHPFDLASQNVERIKKCIVSEADGSIGQRDNASSTSLSIDVPKTDLMASLPIGCIEKMVSRLKFLTTYMTLFVL